MNEEQKTGEQLNRRWHELNGWTWVSGSMWHVPACAHTHAYDDCSGFLPVLHLDANLAIAEALTVFKNGFQLIFGANNVAISVPWRTLPVGSIMPSDVEMLEADGKTACEAILAALIQSKEANPNVR